MIKYNPAFAYVEDAAGQTLLHAAVISFENNQRIVWLLCVSNTPVNKLNRHECTALDIASQEGHHWAIPELLNHGASVLIGRRSWLSHAGSFITKWIWNVYYGVMICAITEFPKELYKFILTFLIYK
jgi:hypothetical protein